jgi:hypothetical protein
MIDNNTIRDYGRGSVCQQARDNSRRPYRVQYLAGAILAFNQVSCLRRDPPNDHSLVGNVAWYDKRPGGGQDSRPYAEISLRPDRRKNNTTARLPFLKVGCLCSRRPYDSTLIRGVANEHEQLGGRSEGRS